jgi:hypothetical protein
MALFWNDEDAGKEAWGFSNPPKETPNYIINRYKPN